MRTGEGDGRLPCRSFFREPPRHGARAGPFNEEKDMSPEDLVAHPDDERNVFDGDEEDVPEVASSQTKPWRRASSGD